jgi:FAD/FMN-containing dehydrogenase
VKALLRTGALLFAFDGRIPRSTLFATGSAVGLVLLLTVPIVDRVAPTWGVVALDVVALWIFVALAVKRLKDRGRSPWRLAVALVPILGPLWLFVELCLRRGTEGANHYGEDPLDRRADYLTVAAKDPYVVEEVTRLYPTRVFAVARPTTVEEVQHALSRTNGPVSIGGGRFSMGGQAASADSLHIDMRGMNRVLRLDLEARTIRVQAGIRWCDIQRVIDPHGLAVKIMQTYANFTVGGSLSVNVHGRYVGLGPLILSVRSISIVLASGERVEASPTENAEIFYGAIGGYGGLGVIVEAELELAENTRVERVTKKVKVGEYLEHFRRTVRDAKGAVFHNGDLYVTDFAEVRSVTWVETKRPATAKHRLMPIKKLYPLENYIVWSVSELPFGAWRREHLIDPFLYLARPVHWRNYEAGYDAGELEPPSRQHRTYVLQEYFVPIERFEPFVARMAEILRRHRVNVLNVSIRHALPDPGSMLAWAREECFAFVLYYKQRTRENAKGRVAVWTRELIQAAIDEGGSYYLPYQTHATAEQLHAAYPRARELFALKAKLDPDFRFRNVLWSTYYEPAERPARLAVGGAADASPTAAAPRSELRRVLADTAGSDALYAFLQNIYRLFPEDRFHSLLEEAAETHEDPASIYRYAQERLPTIRPPLALLTYALPSLAKQKREMTRQTLELLGNRKRIRGCVEIGSTGRYVSHLKKHVAIEGDIVLVNDVAPTGSPVDVVERGQLSVLGRFVPLAEYAPLDPSAIPDASVELVTCYIGLHHADPARVEAFVASIHRVLRPGGVFVLRDHDVDSESMRTFVSLIHTVFNLGLGVPFEVDAAEPRHFESVATWVERVERAGFVDGKARLLQANDPSKNVLMAFTKEAA